jgi:hypothetical protein
MSDLIKNFQDKILERLANQFNHRRSNQIHDEIHSIFKTLREEGKLSDLEPLLTHENAIIANYAATYFLVVDENKAIAALENLASREGQDPFIINHTIKQWKNGEINFDY